MNDKAKINEVTHEEEKNKVKEEVIIKYGFIALGVVLAICIVAFAIISFLPTNLVSIGDEKIAEEEFDYHYYEQANMLYQQILQYYPDVSLEVFMMSEYQAGMTYHEFAKQLALERVSEITIFNDMANKESYMYDESELADSMENFKISFQEYADQANMKLDEAARDLYGCDYKTVTEIYEKTWLSSKYQDDMLRRLQGEVTEEDAAAYYESFRDDLDMVTVKQLFIATYDTEAQAPYSDEEYADAKARAEALLEQANNGDDFDELVMKKSEDPSVGETLGEYTSLKSEIGLVTFEEWAFAAERTEGEFGLVETEIGFHIIEFISRTGYEDAIDAVKGNIAYGEMLTILAEKRALPEYAVGYYNAFSSY